MKNLKRALSLVLSAAMMVGMMAIGTSAAFADVDASDNLEAISVMEMIGVMEGDGENFNPDRVVTRNEMAVVICNLMDLKLNGYHPFTDVPEWADKYVGALYINGLTSGTSATTYGGAAEVTTTDAALMILKTLGYFEYQGEFEDDYALATIKRATLLNLFEGINAGVKDGLTRGEVAQMVLNALTKNVVVAKENGGMKVEGNGITVTEKASYSYNSIAIGSAVDGNGNSYTIYETLKSKLFGKELVGPTKGQEDAFGRPSTKWTYYGNAKTETVTAAKEASLVYTAKVSADAMTKNLKDFDKNSAIQVWVDGKKGAVVAKAGVAALTGHGVTVELYVDTDKNQITDAVVINEYADKVYSVTKADEKTGAKRFVTVNGMTFETENFAKKDKVVYTKAWDGAKYVIKSMKAAEFVEGKITGMVYDNGAIKTVQIDGVSYNVNPMWVPGTDIKLNATVKLVVDTNGNLLWTDTAKAAAPSVDEYVIVTNNAGKDAFQAAQIKVLKADGTTAVVGFEQYTDSDNAANNSEASVANNTLYTMEDADNDGKFEFYKAITTKAADGKYAGFDNVLTTATGLDAAKDVLVNGWEIAADAVVFAHKLNNAGNIEWSVTTGAKLASSDLATIEFAYANKNASGFMGVQLAVVDSKIASSSDVVYGYVTADVMQVKNADNETVDQITFWNGEETVTMLTDKANAGKLAKKAIFAYKVNGDGEITAVAGMTAAAVTGITDEKIALAKADKTAIGTYELDDDMIVVYIDAENVAGAADGEIEIADQNDTETAYILNVMYALNAEGKVCALIVDVLNDIADVL